MVRLSNKLIIWAETLGIQSMQGETRQSGFHPYWWYDDLDPEKIDPNGAWYSAKKMMLPIGIGKTNEEGFLMKSIP